MYALTRELLRKKNEKKTKENVAKNLPDTLHWLPN